MTTTTAWVLAHPEVHGLAEGPTWDDTMGRVRWVDIDSGSVYAAAFGGELVDVERVAQSPDSVGAAIHTTDGGLLVAEATTLRHIAPDGRETHSPVIVSPGVRSRLNDGATDPAGRYLVGTLALDDRVGQERLVRIEHDGGIRVLDDDLHLSNGLGWSPDGSLFYSIDTLTHTVWVRDYEADGDDIGRRRVAFRTPDELPDGMTVDAEGALWIASWGAGEVRRYSPTGKLLGAVHVEAPFTTSAAFIGADLATMLITTSSRRDGGDPGPLGGRLFAAEPGVAGQPARAWEPCF